MIIASLDKPVKSTVKTMPKKKHVREFVSDRFISEAVTLFNYFLILVVEKSGE